MSRSRFMVEYLCEEKSSIHRSGLCILPQNPQMLNTARNVAQSLSPISHFKSTATSTANNNVASVSGNTNYDTSDNPAYQTVVDLDATTNRRVWVGLTSQTSATMGASATPAASYAAFRYDTSAGDTNWMCVTRGGAAAPTATNSGIAASTTAVELEVILVQTTVAEFKINGVLVCTVSTTLPAASTLMRYSNSITNLANGTARTLRTGWVYVEHN